MYENGKSAFCREFSKNICLLVVTANTIRNLYSEAHGTSKGDRLDVKTLPEHHFKLIVDLTITLVNFYIETYFYQEEKEVKF